MLHIDENSIWSWFGALELVQNFQFLASRVTKWSVACDIALHRLICYIHSTADLVLSGYVGDSRNALLLALYADADWAGERVDYKSTSGAISFLGGPTTKFPLGAECAKQTITSFSAPESELVAANLAVRMLGIPFLGVCEKVLTKELKLVLHEDNQSALHIIKKKRQEPNNEGLVESAWQ